MKAMSQSEVFEAMGLNEVEISLEVLIQEQEALDNELKEIENTPSDMTPLEKIESYYGKGFADTWSEEDIIAEAQVLYNGE